VWKDSLLRWLTAGERRREIRQSTSDLVAYYWSGTVPTSHPVRDISFCGAYVVTDDRWLIDTVLMVTLQRGQEVYDAREAITVAGRVVRYGPDGIGFDFMLPTKEERKALRRFLKTRLKQENERAERRGTEGEAIVEFALMVPLLFLLIVNAFNFGSFIYCWITVGDAVRAAADYACLDSSTADSPTTPSVSAITSLVQAATSGLPNYSTSNPSVTVCEYNNGTTTTFLTTSGCPAGVTTPPADPELIASGSTITYSTVAVDVTYTFTPLLNQSSFLRFGLPSLPTTIHRRMVVRWP
jgi:Flp pilus assembly protein TadG